MSAPKENQNAVKYDRKKVIRLMRRAIHSVRKDCEIFNFPMLHRALKLPCSRTLGYIVTKYQSDPGIMELWQKVAEGLNENLKLHCEKKGYPWDVNNCFYMTNYTSLRACAKELKTD